VKTHVERILAELDLRDRTPAVISNTTMNSPTGSTSACY